MNDIISSLILLLILPLSVVCSDRTVGRHFSTRSEVIALNGMAATSQPLATQVAIDILKKGGTAVTRRLCMTAKIKFISVHLNPAKMDKLQDINAHFVIPAKAGI